MGLSEQIRQQLINTFMAEQQEHVQKMTEGLLALEKNPNGEKKQMLLDEVFREAHSLKGSARAVGMTTIATLGHHMEELLMAIRDGQRAFTPVLFDLLHKSLDAVTQLTAQLDKGETAPSAAILSLLAQLEEAVKATDEGETAAVEPESAVDAASTNESVPETRFQDETIRVSTNKLDALMGQFSELVGAKIRAEQRLAEVRQMQNFAADWYKDWSGLRGTYNRLLRTDQPSKQTQGKDIDALMTFTYENQERLRTFTSQSNMLYRQFSNDIMRLSLIIDELQEEIKRVRMLPLATITTTFGRTVRDVARAQEKQVDLVIEGAETELDKRVLEQIKDPLLHLLRNAVDHGLEDSATRQAAGKAAEGTITLSASQQGNNIVIQVQDDGRGLDLNAIRQAAVRRNLITAVEAEKLNDSETAALIFNSGLSTSRIITDVSGRGVGMDVVRQNIEALQGTINIDTKLGFGTTFIMTLPLTLASSRGLLVEAGGQTFALPLNTVERMLQVKRSDVSSVEGRQAINYQGRPIALASLADLLDLPANTQQSEILTVVIIGVTDKRLALVVDELAGEQEIVMKSLGKQLAKVGGFAGATVLGSGEVILVLHAADLVKLSARTPSRLNNHASVPSGGMEQAKQVQTILVVDDSITTRTLEKNILEAAGYHVKLATNGQEALAILATDGLPNLVISDVNMPYLDGLGLAQQIKQDSRYQDIPVILVTSLDSPADKARGIEVGADAYIVKSRFDQSTLLETIEQLII